MNAMAHKYRVGDVVRILSLGEWLTKDLPMAEREGILACIGKSMAVTEIDKWGAIWVGFGKGTDDGDDATYVGQSFIVEIERIELVTAYPDGDHPTE